ncbi:hypothetical protein ES332_D08G314000v1 [Gossypium tomentosum]|uniref:Uncharacterized protein n=1 Tax=Gossypium tomentosum TaxID=34277 RepID=A0A5D2K0Q3_GOSTO|nr:hypothetical protein ES332_D08G314000v1 [Gossypium tomentosum]
MGTARLRSIINNCCLHCRVFSNMQSFIILYITRKYYEKYVKPKDVVGAEEVKSSDKNCLVLYMMFSSRKIRTRQNRVTSGKIPTYPSLSLLSMDVCVN